MQTVFDLPRELLVTLHLKNSSAPQQTTETETIPPRSNGVATGATGQLEGTTKASTSCVLCGANFLNVQEQRRHVKSDWHSYNLKQKLKRFAPVDENEFEKLVGELDESISGSESLSESDDDNDTKESTLTALLKKQANLKDGEYDADVAPRKPKRGSGKSPLLWFSTSLLPSYTSLGIYKALFTDTEQEEESHILDVLRSKQLPPTPPKTPQGTTNGVPLPSTPASPQIFLCMIGGGHFAAMIVSLAPKIGKKPGGVDERQATVIAHKTFHRYTTRRKQGGSQSANDSAKGAAHSAGSSLRRYNEVALEAEIRALLAEWKEMIRQSQLIFARATGSTNRRTLFGPYDDQVLRHNDPRNRSFPFSTRRATQAELMRAFIELTRVQVSQVDEAALAAAAAVEATKDAASKASPTPFKPSTAKPSKEEEASSLHTSQLQALIRRSKAPAVISYISNNALSPDFIFHPASTQANHHAPTPLHLAASINSPAVILALLTKAGANPSNFNGEGKPPFDLAGDRGSRDAFRVARSELGEYRWDWTAAHVPPALSKAEADKREGRERLDAEKTEGERRKAETERLRRETEMGAYAQQGKKPAGRALGAVEKTGAERREEEARGMTPEMRTRLERERRARAAEERIRRMAGGVGGGGPGR